MKESFVSGEPTNRISLPPATDVVCGVENNMQDQLSLLSLALCQQGLWKHRLKLSASGRPLRTEDRQGWGQQWSQAQMCGMPS